MLCSEHVVKIVVISNDQIMHDSLENMLDSARFVFNSIKPLPESIAEIRKEPPDIFLIDNLSSDDEILHTCLNIRSYFGAPILVLAADHRPELVELVLDAGADEFLLKPVSGNIMAAYLNNLARRARAEKDAALSIVDGSNQKEPHSRLLTY